jgi:hypothetical protein
MLRADDLPTCTARMDDQEAGPKSLRNTIDTPSDRLLMSYI